MATSDKSLGPQITVYRGPAFIGRGFLPLLLFSAVAVLAPLGYGIYRAQYAYANYGPVAARFWSRPWYLLAGISLLLVLILLLLRLGRSRRYVAVHRNGLRIRLSRRQQFTWSSLSGIASGAVQTRLLGLPLRTRYQAEIYPSISASLRLDDSLENLPELLTRIKANLYPHLLPRLQQAFDEDKWLYFGPLAIRKAELRLGEKDRSPVSLPWSQVKSVSVKAGMLVIEAETNQQIRLPVARVPNLELLLQIIQTGVHP